MASSSGTSSGSSSLNQNSGSDEDLQALMDQRKRKRMISNRESARRSRMRKQKHLDDVTAQVAQIGKENHQIITTMNITAQHYLSIEAENQILRAQVGELSHRLQSLNEIIEFLSASFNVNNGVYGAGHNLSTFAEPTSYNHLNMAYLNQPVVASADMFQ